MGSAFSVILMPPRMPLQTGVSRPGHHFPCPERMPIASDRSPLMSARPSAQSASKNNEFWCVCTMLSLLHDGSERCGHNRVMVADVRRAMGPSAADPVHG